MKLNIKDFLNRLLMISQKYGNIGEKEDNDRCIECAEEIQQTLDDYLDYKLQGLIKDDNN